MFKKRFEKEILEWAKSGELEGLCAYLVSGSVHGNPGIPTAELSRIEKILRKSVDEKALYSLGKRLLKRREYSARSLGIHLIELGWRNKEVETLLKAAANDEDWIVRESAAGVFAILLEKDYSRFSKLFSAWVKNESINVKRAIALAVKYDSKSGDSKKWKTYLSLIDPLMQEGAEYIRKNLGPFAIGDGLLGRFPDQILAECKRWAKSKNENVRWNTAMIFTAATARRFQRDGKILLKPLIEDESSFVAKAAQKAMKNLERVK